MSLSFHYLIHFLTCSPLVTTTIIQLINEKGLIVRVRISEGEPEFLYGMKLMPPKYLEKKSLSQHYSLKVSLFIEKNVFA